MDILLSPNGAAETDGRKPFEVRAMDMRSGKTAVRRDERGQNDQRR